MNLAAVASFFKVYIDKTITGGGKTLSAVSFTGKF